VVVVVAALQTDTVVVVVVVVAALQTDTVVVVVVVVAALVHCVAKKVPLCHWPLPSPNTNQFSKFFH